MKGKGKDQDTITLQTAAWNTTNTLQHISDLITKGMNNRITSVRVIFDTRDHGGDGGPRNIVVGLHLHPIHSSRLLDRGPSADNTEACEVFRTFWGEKSDLRRFKDGTILEACFWGNQNNDMGNEKHHIPGRVAKYIISRHCTAASDVLVVGDAQVDPWLSSSVEATKIMEEEAWNSNSSSSSNSNSNSSKKRKRRSNEEKKFLSNLMADTTMKDTRRVLDAATSLTKFLSSDRVGGVDGELPLRFDSLQIVRFNCYYFCFIVVLAHTHLY
jgi:hypothetical protein